MVVKGIRGIYKGALSANKKFKKLEYYTNYTLFCDVFSIKNTYENYYRRGW
jgi:hypothetical protein